MKIRHTFDFDDEDREAIAHSMDEKGTASRDTVLKWIADVIDTQLAIIRQEYLLETDRAEADDEEEATEEVTPA